MVFPDADRRYKVGANEVNPNGIPEARLLGFAALTPTCEDENTYRGQTAAPTGSRRLLPGISFVGRNEPRELRRMKLDPVFRCA
jgi:hypothetical protein